MHHPEVQLAAHNEQGKLVRRGQLFRAVASKCRAECGFWSVVCRLGPVFGRVNRYAKVTSGTAVTFRETQSSLRIVYYVNAVYTNYSSQGLSVMRIGCVVVVALALSTCLGPGSSAQSQQPSPSGARKVTRQVTPDYPEAARRIGLGGTVKVIALVAPDGSVSRVEPVGGSPVLMQAAENAIMKWKYAPGSESRESVELHFRP